MVLSTSELILSNPRKSTFWSLIRSTPISLLGTLILINIIYPSHDNFIFILLYMFTFGSNMIFKVIAKYIYTILDTDYIPFIGQGTRPLGAHSCSSFISTPLIPSISYGMPSGHSQLAWFFSIYACLSVINMQNQNQNQNQNQTTNKKILSCMALILLAITISYSRIHIEECHTTEQVVIGGIIGTTIAIASFYIKNALALFA